MIDFQQFIGERTGVKRNEILASANECCECGVDDWDFLSKADKSDAPEVGELFLIVKCKSCERLKKDQRGHALTQSI